MDVSRAYVWFDLTGPDRDSAINRRSADIWKIILHRCFVRPCVRLQRRAQLRHIHEQD